MTFLMSIVQKDTASGKKLSPVKTLFAILVLGAASYWGFGDAEAMQYSHWTNFNGGGYHTFIDGSVTYRCGLEPGERKMFGTSRWDCDANGVPVNCLVVGPPVHLEDCKEL